MKNLLLFIVFILTIQLNAQEELIGNWYRVEDRAMNPNDSDMPTQDSTILEVKYYQGELVGILMKVPKTSIPYGYKTGQVKWKNITKTGKNQFELYGLLMEIGTPGIFDKATWLKVQVNLIENKNTILLYTDSQGDRFNWSKQKWIRLPNV